MEKSSGVTLIELVVALLVLSMLLGLTWIVGNGYLQFARDNERRTDMTTTARTFERYYRNQAAANGAATYPTVVQVNDSTQLAAIIPLSDERLKAPLQTSVSLSAATTTAVPAPTTAQYIYQPFTATDTICTAAANTPCVRFSLSYRSEKTAAITTIESIHQQ